MKSLKELLFAGMFVVMTAAMFVACGDKGGEAPEASTEATEAVDGAVVKAVEGSTAVKEAAKEIKKEAEEEEWFPEDVVPSGSAANN